MTINEKLMTPNERKWRPKAEKLFPEIKTYMDSNGHKTTMTIYDFIWALRALEELSGQLLKGTQEVKHEVQSSRKTKRAPHHK
jgi:hypothetical protein